MTLDEAPQHPHVSARQTLVHTNGQIQPAPAPRLSATPAALPTAPRRAGQDAPRLLQALGYSDDRISALRAAGTVI